MLANPSGKNLQLNCMTPGWEAQRLNKVLCSYIHFKKFEHQSKESLKLNPIFVFQFVMTRSGE